MQILSVRLDWGFHNPNKTAALIAILSLSVWLLAYIRKWGFWASLSLFTGLGVCMILTQSRGGLTAELIGGLILLAWAPRPFTRSRVIGVVILSALLTSLFCLSHLETRTGRALTGQDRSIGNRLLIWEHVPAMIHDAPSGWGIGSSGDAYMQWYQPVQRMEGYRTLVNSHLTWLVEFNWWGRSAYVLAWALLFVLLWLRPGCQWFSIPLAVWVAFGVTAIFSSVAEAWPLWIIPGVLLASVLAVRLRKGVWPKGRQWAFGVAGGVVLLGVIFLLSERASSSAIYSPSQGVVLIGSKSPGIWIVAPNRAVLGEHYGHELRRVFEVDAMCREKGVGVVPSLASIPKNQILVISGAVPDSLSKYAPAQVILINPEPSSVVLAALNGLPKVTIIVGEFALNKYFWMDQSHSHPNITVQSVVGDEDYIPQWMQEVMASIKGVQNPVGLRKSIKLPPAPAKCFSFILKTSSILQNYNQPVFNSKPSCQISPGDFILS